MSLYFSIWVLELIRYIKLFQNFNVKIYYKGRKFYFVVLKVNFLEIVVVELKIESGWDFFSDLL